MLHQLKYRIIPPGMPPRKIRLQIPGWSGESDPQADGSALQPWHCPPVVEAATYGLELLYPLANECRVSVTRGKLRVVGDFGAPPNDTLQWPPFQILNRNFFGFNTFIDIKVKKDHVLRIEPHPRCFVEKANSAPIAVMAHLRANWWPMVFNVTFRAPPKGGVHVFRFGEPYAQVLIVPTRAQYDLRLMSDDEAAERELQARRIVTGRNRYALKRWVSRNNNFGGDGLYRHLTRVADRRQKKQQPKR